MRKARFPTRWDQHSVAREEEEEEQEEEKEQEEEEGQKEKEEARKEEEEAHGRGPVGVGNRKCARRFRTRWDQDAIAQGQ